MGVSLGGNREWSVGVAAHVSRVLAFAYVRRRARRVGR
jgi:hypothetical protein